MHFGARAAAAVAAVVIIAAVGINLAGSSRTPIGATPLASGAAAGNSTATPGPASATPDPKPSATPAKSPAALTGTGLVVFEYTPFNGPARPQLQTLDSTGLPVAFLPSDKGRQQTPVWSADGARLAFTGSDSATPDGADRIWETDASASTPRLISTACTPPACVEEGSPAFSADGARLAFVRTSGSDFQNPTSTVIAVRDLESGTVTELKTTRRPFVDGYVTHPRWSPDGSLLAYHFVTWSADQHVTDSSAFIVDTDGKNLRRLTPPDLSAGDAEWSPDGSTILFASIPYRDWMFNVPGASTQHIYTIARDGSGMSVLPVEPASTPTWADDGATILYAALRDQGRSFTLDLMAMDKDGSSVRSMAKFSDCCRWYPVQQPTP